MNERMRESLSALMDDEANELELERVLAHIADDDDLRQTWVRYNAARTAVSGHQLAHMDMDISTRVRSSGITAAARSPTTIDSHRKKWR